MRLFSLAIDDGTVSVKIPSGEKAISTEGDDLDSSDVPILATISTLSRGDGFKCLALATTLEAWFSRFKEPNGIFC
jgi:hypothetical protein